MKSFIQFAHLQENSAFVKSMRYLYGLKDIGNGIAIMTSQNPSGKITSKEENIKNWKLFTKELESKKYKYFIQNGIYDGNPEKYAIIINISDEETNSIAFDTRWMQDAYIHGELVNNEIIFKMQKRNGKIIRTSSIQSNKLVQGLKDYYSYFQSIRNKKAGNPLSSIEKRKFKLGFSPEEDYINDN